ncbi:MAG: hypothetical protein JWO44_2307 [Bacteroidetes bacterium]|nr:hypothetical protein [Bacteroidota bacterium]
MSYPSIFIRKELNEDQVKRNNYNTAKKKYIPAPDITIIGKNGKRTFFRMNYK